MQFPLQVTFEGLKPTDAIRAHVDGQLEKIERLGRSIRQVRVTIRLPHRHGGRAAEFQVGVEVRLPHQRPIVVRARRPGDLYACITEAFTAASRTLAARLSRKQQRERQAAFV